MKKLLVGLDGSPRERGVLDAAVALGKRTGAKLLLFRSVGIPYAIPSEALAVAPADLSNLLERAAIAQLQEVEKSIPNELRGGVRVVTGTPWDAVCRAAQEEDADVIIVGSHGYGTVDRLIGTTAAKIVNHADRSVLVVRAPERFV